MKRLHINGDSNCFIAMNNHKTNFENESSVSLINPAMNEIKRISQQILDKITVGIKSKFKLNQWKSTKEVIAWFLSIDEKLQFDKFIQFDIKQFYRSIKESLLEKS